MSFLALAIPVVVFAAIALVTLGLTTGQNPDEMAARLGRYNDVVTSNVDSDTPPPPKAATSPRDLLALVSGLLNPLMARSSHTGKLADDLQRADLKMKPSEWLLIVFAVGIVLGGILGIRFGSIIFGAIGLVVGYFGMGFYLRHRQKKRSRAFNRQLGDTIILLSNALKAGYSFAQALATVSKTAHPPIAEEFARGTREIALGVPVDDALAHMVKRNQSDDFDLMVTAVQIQRVVGGNLAEILDTIAFTIRERVRIQGEIRTLTAQARASGYIISAIPLAICLFLSLVQPSYFTPMFSHTLGQALLGLALVMMGIGFAIMQKITKIKV